MNHDADVKSKVRDVFGRNAEKYVTSELHSNAQALSQVENWLQPQPAWMALDIATGGGHVAKTLAPHVAHMTATDLTAEMLQAARRHIEQAGLHNLSYVLADAEALPFLDGSFDAVTCRIAPHHFPHPERFVAEVSRVLKPGGLFLLIDNVAPEEAALDDFMNTVERLRDESHVRCAKVSEWRAWLAASGLNEQRIELHKKTYKFPGWVERTSCSPEQTARVLQYLLSASEPMRETFNVVIEDGDVRSFQVDEMMMLIQKA